MEQQITIEDFHIYLRAIGIPKDLKINVSVESLYLLANKQFTYLHYQNHELHLKNRNPSSLKIKDLIERLCIKQVGGLCYEHELLLYYFLNFLGFNVHLIRCQVREANQEYNLKTPFTHAFLCVKLEGINYLIDPGFGTRSLRYPIKVNFEDLTPTHDLFPQEHYRISENQTHYQMQHLIEQNWVTYYDFDKPLIFASVEEINQDYLNLFTDKNFLGIRDNRFLVCRNTDLGKIQYTWFRIEKQFTAFKRKYRLEKNEKTVFQNYEEMKEDVRKELDIIISDLDQLY